MAIPAPLASRRDTTFDYRWHPRAYPPPPIAEKRRPSNREYSDNGFAIQVRQREEWASSTSSLNHRPDGYVEASHGLHYTLRLFNHNGTPCDAVVTVDNDEEIGTFRIRAYGQVDVEGPPNDGRRFTFYKADSLAGDMVGIKSGKRSNGVVSVRFIPAYRRTYPLTNAYFNGEEVDLSYFGVGKAKCMGGGMMTDGFMVQSATAESYSRGSEGATGLAGHTSQRFRRATELDLDHSRTTTLGLRLICVSPSSTYERVRDHAITLETAQTSFIW